MSETGVPPRRLYGRVSGPSSSPSTLSSARTPWKTPRADHPSAVITYHLNSTDDAAFAILNVSGIRATIDAGPITREDVLTAFPFGNAVVEITLTGAKVWEALEGIISGVSVDNGRSVTSFLQISRGLTVEYDPRAEVGLKLVAVTVGDAALDMAAEYKIVTVDFLAGGGDNFFSPATEDFVALYSLNEVLARFVRTESPVNITIEGRIVQVTAGNGSTTTNATSWPTTSPTVCKR